MNEERIIALWTEYIEVCTPFLEQVDRLYEYKITVLITHDSVEFHQYSRVALAKEWIIDNKIVGVPRDRLLEMLNEKVLP